MENKYAFLMIDYETPKIIKDIHDSLKKDEIYNDDSNDYGIEDETHVTLVPCLSNDCDINEIKKLLLPLNKYDIVLTNVSSFKNDLYDVLKCDAHSKFLYDTNKLITDKFDTYSDFKDYRPHVTIAYLKKDMSERYEKNILDNIIKLKPKCFHFSYYKNGVKKDLYFK